MVREIITVFSLSALFRDYASANVLVLFGLGLVFFNTSLSHNGGLAPTLDFMGTLTVHCSP